MDDKDNAQVHKMHWWFFVDKFVPWIIAAVVLVFVGKVSVYNPLMDDLYVRTYRYAAALIVAGMTISFLVSFAQWSFTTLTLDNGYLVYEKGIIRRNVAKIPVQEIASIDLQQSIFQRLLNTGDLVIDMRGASLLRMRLIDDPVETQNAILGVRNATLPL